MTEQPIDLKEVVGSILLAANDPMDAKQIRLVLKQTALTFGEETEVFAKAKEADVQKALDELVDVYAQHPYGLEVVQVANGYRLQNQVKCGPWLRVLLDKGKPQKLSRPALETLSVIAYRQPCTRAEIEEVRGVSSDSIVRSLLEMELIKVAGRSELPGKPWLFGTTDGFLQYFGLKNIYELPDMDELGRRQHEVEAGQAEQLELNEDDPVDPSDDEPEAEVDSEQVEEEPLELDGESVEETEPPEELTEPVEVVDEKPRS